MKKTQLFIITLLLSVSLSQANELFKITLSKDQKLENTFSASLANNTTLHIAVISNKESKKYDLIPVYIDSQKQAKKLTKMVFDEIPVIVSYHLNNNIASLITHNEKKEELSILDFNLTTGASNVNKLKDEAFPDNVFRLNNKTTLVYTEKEAINSITIENAGLVSYSGVKVPEEYQNKFKKFLKNNPQAINQNEYVKNGSINDARAYLKDDQIIFTENTKSFGADLYIFDFEKQTVDVSEFNFRNTETKYRGFNTYIQDENLFVVLNNKEDVLFKTQSIVDKTSTSEISIKNSLQQLKKEAKTLDNFLKASNKANMKPTVTLNKNDMGNFVVRLDYVNKNTYQYHHDWWFHHWMFHQNNMMMQRHIQMQTQNMSFGSGPNPEYFNTLPEIYTTPSKEEESYAIEFEYNINSKTIIEDGNLNTTFKNIDKDSHLDEFENNKKMKEFTADFTENDFRYIYQDKKTKTIYIKYENL